MAGVMMTSTKIDQSPADTEILGLQAARSKWERPALRRLDTSDANMAPGSLSRDMPYAHNNIPS